MHPTLNDPAHPRPPDSETGRAIDRLLKDKEAAARLGVAVSTFRRYVAGGLVPQPLKLGGTSRWLQSEILAVIQAAKAARPR